MSRAYLLCLELIGCGRGLYKVPSKPFFPTCVVGEESRRSEDDTAYTMPGGEDWFTSYSTQILEDLASGYIVYAYLHGWERTNNSFAGFADADVTRPKKTYQCHVPIRNLSSKRGRQKSTTQCPGKTSQKVSLPNQLNDKQSDPNHWRILDHYEKKQTTALSTPANTNKPFEKTAQ